MRMVARELGTVILNLVAWNSIKLKQFAEKGNKSEHDHVESQFRMRADPYGVITDSGWNCIPLISSDWCAIAMITPSIDRAVTRRLDGRDAGSTAHE